MATFTRNDWGAQPPKAQRDPLHSVPYVAIHDIGGGDPYPSNVGATLRSIQAQEQAGAYSDIAYCWGVDQHGDLWILRGDVADGATLGYAGIVFSILAICNASAPNFVATPELLTGISDCILAAIARGVVAPDATIDGHQWFDSHVTAHPTACPGAGIIPRIPEIRTHVQGGAPPPAPTPPPATTEDEMVILTATGRDAALFDLDKVKTITAPTVAAFQAAGIKVVKLAPVEYDRLTH